MSSNNSPSAAGNGTHPPARSRPTSPSSMDRLRAASRITHPAHRINAEPAALATATATTSTTPPPASSSPAPVSAATLRVSPFHSHGERLPGARERRMTVRSPCVTLADAASAFPRLALEPPQPRPVRPLRAAGSVLKPALVALVAHHARKRVMDPRTRGGHISLGPIDPGGSDSPVDAQSSSPQAHNSVAFVKGGKRKRLSKDVLTDDLGSPHIDLSQPIPNPPTKEHNASPKRNRSGTSSRSPTGTFASSSQHSPQLPQPSEPRSKLLDPDTTHELVNLFFAHCNPHRLILHKPSFSAALSHNRVPEYLVLALCAVAAPLSKSIAAQASIARVAGVPFYQDAVRIMFDNAGRLLSEPTLETAQALCLMEMHEIAASHSWTKHNKYFVPDVTSDDRRPRAADLALKVLEESLEVEKSDDQVRGRTDDLDFCIERECTRRCFWLIQCMSWISGIYIYKPVRPRSVDMTKKVRLPIDETTFDLAAHWNSATVEYLHVQAPTTRYASQFGHVLRILSIYQTVQNVIVQNEGPARAQALRECRQMLDNWLASLPQHLKFSEDNVQKQIDMFETSSNTAFLEGEGRLGEPIEWVRDQLGTIFNATGTRAKNTILSACVIWSYSRYYPDDPKIRVWDTDFEKVWGFRVLVVADQWRQVQERDRAQANASPNASPPHVAGVSPTIAKNNVLMGPGRQGGFDVAPPHHHGDMGLDHRASCSGSDGAHSGWGSEPAIIEGKRPARHVPAAIGRVCDRAVVVPTGRDVSAGRPSVGDDAAQLTGAATAGEHARHVKSHDAHRPRLVREAVMTRRL
ncbi:hypothetical protein EVJ58_g964 [Rhodofomes roseus]|uniref:Xylanolytic transcriptional activator regulatory domain-containing protein n=1 Tax=Rhodofomes roseus TaxID=34475 RepID=A0A4Y9Z3M1_9APHY|nr:hypothetical protein EVJ58_g964 [Rhodofomes roseus]